MKIEDVAVGPDSILYISYYEKYLEHGAGVFAYRLVSILNDNKSDVRIGNVTLIR